MQIFSERLKDLRKEAGISAKQLAKELGISDSIIIRWENDQREPTISNLYKISVYFKVSADYLIGLED